MSESPLRIITEPCRLAFPALREPKPRYHDNPRLTYQATVLLPPDYDLKPIAAVMKAAMMRKWHKVIRLKPIYNPIRNCEEKDECEGYDEGWRYINTHTGYKPDLVDAAAEPILDTEVFYPGCWCKFALDVFAWDKPKVGQGVSFSLTALQFFEDDDRFDNKVSATDLFTAIEVEGGGGASTDPLADLIG